jgi:hypothetical protein
MLTQPSDSPGATYSIDALVYHRQNQHCYADLPALGGEGQSPLIEQVINFAFETLGARRLDARLHRIYPEREYIPS